MMKALTISLLFASACAARPSVVASPSHMSEAAQLYLSGATTAQVASELSVEPDAARELLRLTVRDLNRAYYQRR